MAVEQIDAALAAISDVRSRAQYDDLSDIDSEAARVRTLCVATVERLTQPGSSYRRIIEDSAAQWNVYHGKVVDDASGALEALKQDYEAGYMASLPELVRAELFADLLEMADHLLDGSFKDAAAVIAGSTLEGHLRQLGKRLGFPQLVRKGGPFRQTESTLILSRPGLTKKRIKRPLRHGLACETTQPMATTANMRQDRLVR